jgi:hypothetical protein
MCAALCALRALKGIEEIKESVNIFLDAQFAFVPGGERNPGFEIFYLEPVFDVDG